MTINPAAEAEESDLGPRVWARDQHMWGTDVTARLGWLDLPQTMPAHLEDLAQFAEQARADGLDRVLVCGMGGSTLCVHVLAQVLGTPQGGAEVRVLDSTHPEAVAAAARWATPERTLYVIASKSGTTMEPLDFAAYFSGVAAAHLDPTLVGSRFVAITDPGTPLATHAATQHWRGVFENPPDIGGRYSALSLFGLLPATMQGSAVSDLLARARGMAEACGPAVPDVDNPGVALGQFLATQALAGRDKVTIVTVPQLASFGLWIEQLLAESTGKLNRGLIPVVDEPTGPSEVFGPDRAVVALHLGEQSPPLAAELLAAGHPVLNLYLGDALDLGAEFYRWEFATAIAGHLLGVNAFDQPDVQTAKDATRAALEQDPVPDPEGTVQIRSAEDLAAAATTLGQFLSGVRPPHYVAIMAYLSPDPEIDTVLTELQTAIRQATQAATTVGYGPRFLHSTGQLHKGGPPTGVFLQVVASSQADLAIPDRDYSFGRLVAAQADGDFAALATAGRKILRMRLDADLPLRSFASVLSTVPD